MKDRDIRKDVDGNIDLEMDQELEETLVAFLDGELGDDALASFAGRLASDAALRSELRGQARLRRLTSELPEAIEPERDLFPQIAARLDSRREAAVERGPWGLRRERRGGRGRRSPGVWRQALAALLGIGLGVGLTFAAFTGSKTETGAMDPSLETPSNPPVTAQRSVADERIASARFDDAAVSAQIEADFLRARESLWIELLVRRQELPPETWRAVVENLGLLDRVIRELRQALDQDPGNRRLERLLLSSHQRQLDVLHKVTREV